MKVSLVIPVYNEADNISWLSTEISAIMSGQDFEWECIWIDDASLDSTWTEIKKLCPPNKGMRLKSNCGQTTATKIGIDAAKFEYIVTFTSWALVANSTTDITGRYSFSRATNPSIEYYISFTPPSLPSITNTDAQISNNVTLGTLALKSRDYFRFDINNDGRITISDTYSIFARKNGLINSFIASPPDSRIFTSAQWSIINANTSNLKLSYPGVQSVTINNPVSGGVSSYYITRLGYSN